MDWMTRTLLWLVLVADSSGIGPRWVSDFPSEHLGNSYSYVGTAQDLGLEVEIWRNELLDRQEHWYKRSGDEFFLRVKDGLYVLGLHTGGEWKTVPSVRLVHRDGSWKKLTLGIPEP
jgi:hypothetical protein